MVSAWIQKRLKWVMQPAPSRCKSFPPNLNCFLIVPIYPTDRSLFQFGIITNRSRRKWTKRSLPLHSSPEQMSEQKLIRSLRLFEFSVTFSKIQEEELFILVVCFCFCNRRSADGSLVRSPVRLCPSDHERCKATELPLLLLLHV